MENQSWSFDRKSSDTMKEPKYKPINTERLQQDREAQIWHLAEGHELPSDHPSQGPFPTD